MLVALAAALACASPAAASSATCTDSWNGLAADGLWSDGANWSLGSAPATGDVACIPQGASVELDAATTNFTVAGLELDGATLTTDGSESLTVTDELDLQNATPGSTGTPDVLGSGLILNTQGTTNVDPDLDVCLATGATLDDSGTLTLGDGADLGAADTVACGGGTSAGQITDEGTIIVPGSATIASASFDNEGAVDMTGTTGTLDLQASSSNSGNGDSGTYAIPQGTTLEFDATHRVINYTGTSGTTFSGAGTLTFASGTTEFDSDGDLGTLNHVAVDNGATAEVDATFEGPAGGATPTLTINGELDGDGFATIPSGTATTLDNNDAQLGGEIDVVNDGVMTVVGSVKACINEDATLENSGTLALGSNSALGVSSFNTNCDPSGSLLNDQGASLTSAGNSTINAGTFDNAGAVTVANSSTLVVDADSESTDTGSYAINGSNATFAIQGGVSRVLEGTISGTGKLSVSGSSTSLEVMPDASGSIGTLNVSNGATLQLDAGNATPQVPSAPALAVTGAASFTNSTFAFNGDALTAPTATETLSLLSFTSETGTPKFPKDDNTWEASFGTIGSGSGIVATITPVPPQNQTPPTISGSAAAGGTLTVTQGTWSGSPSTVTDQWQDCDQYGDPCTAVGSGPTYSPTQDEVGDQLQVVETATNAGGSNSAESAMTDAVTTLAPVNLSPPEIDGDEGTAGEVLTEVAGEWQNNPGVALQWEDCDITGTTCTPIPGATGAAYTTTEKDVNDAIVVVETATNAYGSAQAASDPTEPLMDLSAGDDPTDPTGSGSGSGGRHSSGTATVSVPAHTVSGTDLSVALRCPKRSSCPVTLTLTATEPITTSHANTAARGHRTRSRVVVVGSQWVKIAAGDRRTVTVSLNRTGTKLLARTHTLRTVLTASNSHSTLEQTQVTFTATPSTSKRSKPTSSASKRHKTTHKRAAHHHRTHTRHKRRTRH